MEEQNDAIVDALERRLAKAAIERDEARRNYQSLAVVNLQQSLELADLRARIDSVDKESFDEGYNAGYDHGYGDCDAENNDT